MLAKHLRVCPDEGNKQLTCCFWVQLNLQQHLQREHILDHTHDKSTPYQANKIMVHTCRNRDYKITEKVMATCNLGYYFSRLSSATVLIQYFLDKPTSPIEVGIMHDTPKMLPNSLFKKEDFEVD